MYTPVVIRRMQKRIYSYWESFVSILFPSLCVACKNVLLHQEEFICTTCRFHLPITDHWLFEDNEVTQRLLGKTHIEAGSAYLSFTKSSLVQAMIHELKYQQNNRIGKYLGECLGKQLLNSPFFTDIDLIVPVPLYKKKERIRGYNQSERIAQGIAEVMSLPVNRVDFMRIEDTETQTKKNREERFENVEQAFCCNNPIAFEGRHVLLVDDVLTTGATIASASRTLSEEAGCKISVAVLAIARS